MRPFPPALLVLLAVALVAPSGSAAPLDERGTRVDASVTPTPGEVMVGQGFAVNFSLTNRGGEPMRVTLFTGLYTPTDGSRCDEGGATFHGYVNLRSPTVRVAPGETVRFPPPGEVPYSHRIDAHQTNGPGRYEACLWAVDADSPPPGTILDSAPFPIQVRVDNGLPDVGFTWTPDSGNTSTPFRFEALVGDDPEGDALTYRWDFGYQAASGRARAEGPVVTWQFYPARTYTVTLTVSDGFGEATASHDVTVAARPPEGERALRPAAAPEAETPAAGLPLLAMAALAAALLNRRAPPP